MSVLVFSLWLGLKNMRNEVKLFTSAGPEKAETTFFCHQP
jgi:hypothetical protein